jgi:hypothetical protein
MAQRSETVSIVTQEREKDLPCDTVDCLKAGHGLSCCLAEFQLLG